MSYIHDTLGQCVIRYFLSKAEDEEIHEVLDYALHLAEKHIPLD
jgi:hypothetical protein